MIEYVGLRLISMLTKVCQHRGDIGHVLDNIIWDMSNPLGKRIQIHRFYDL